MTLEARVTEIESDIVALAADFTDRLAEHSVRIDVAHYIADQAQTRSYETLAQVYQTGLDAQTYTDAQIQILRSELQGRFIEMATDLRDQVGADVVVDVGTQIQDVLDQTAAAIAAAEQEALAMSLQQQEALAALNALTDSILPIQRQLIDETALEIQETQGHVDELNDEFVTEVALLEQLIANNFTLAQNYTNTQVATEVAQVRDDLDAEIADLEALAASNLTLAKEHADTQVATEAVARQNATDALALQLQIITANINSENLFTNPLFIDGLDGWSGTGQTLVAKDEQSPDPIVADAPALNFVWLATASSSLTALYQQPAIEWADGEQFRWHVSAASPVVRSGSGRLRIGWFDVNGTIISPPGNVYIPLDFPVANEWKTFSGTAIPPVGATSVLIAVQIPGTTAYTTPIAVADLSVKKVDPSVTAQLAQLEAAIASEESARTLWQNTAITRFEDAEGAITQEGLTRANADSALSGRIDITSATLDRGESVISDQYLNTWGSGGWTRWGSAGTLTRGPSTVHPAGTDWKFTVTAAQQDGMFINQSQPVIWPGQLNADGYVVEVEYTLHSGSLDGAAVRLDWNTTTSEFFAPMRLDAMQAGSNIAGRTSIARGVFVKPAGFTGTFTSHDLYVFANNSSPAIGPLSAKEITFHKVRIRVATEEEMGRGIVATEISAAISSEAYARAQADGALSATIDAVTATVGDNTAAIMAEQVARTDADTALSGRIDVVTATAGDNTAAISSEALARANADSALSGRIDTVTTTAGNNTAAITSEALARANADTALSGRIDTVESVSADNTAAITTEQIARANADTALGTQINTVSATASSKNRTYRQQTAPTAGLVAGDIWYDTSSAGKNMPKRWSGSAWTAVPDLRITENAAAISSEATARATADSALGLRIDSVTATAGDNTAAITYEALARANADSALTGQIDLTTATLKRGNSVIADQFLSGGWSRWTAAGSLTRRANEIYPVGDTWDFTVTNEQNDGMQIGSTGSEWPGQTDAAGYVVEMEYTLVSGSLSGSGFYFRWSSGSSYDAVVSLSAAQAGVGVSGKTRTARFVAKKPSNFTGTFASNRVYFFCNYTHAAFGARTNKRIKVHRINIRVATEEELGLGVAAAEIIASVKNEVYTKVQADQAVATATQTLKASMEGTGGSVKAAQDAAQAASNLAGSKGKVIVQSSAPAAADRQAQNLWIDTTSGANTPKRWNGSAWVAVTDKAAKDAASAATAAQNTANAAQTAAQAASNLAGSKGKVLVQSTAPASADRQVQNLWIDTTGGANTPKRWSGSAWVAVTDKVAKDAAAAAAAAQQTANLLQANVTNTATALTNHRSAIASFQYLATTGSGSSAGIRAVSITNSGNNTNTSSSTLALVGDNVIAPGTLSTNALVVGLGKNLLIDPSFEDGQAHYSFWSNNGATVAVLPPGVAWAHPGWPTLRIMQSDSTSTGYANLSTNPYGSDGTKVPGVPVEPGRRYMASAYFSTHRCNTQLFIQWYDASGNAVGSVSSPSQNLGQGSSNSPDSWPRYFCAGVAPSTARYARLIFRKYGTTSGSNSYLFVWKPQLEEVHAQATQPSPWSPGGVTYINGGRLFANSITAREVATNTLTATHMVKTANLITHAAQMGTATVGTLTLGTGAATSIATTTIPQTSLGLSNVWTSVGSLTIPVPAGLGPFGLVIMVSGIMNDNGQHRILVGSTVVESLNVANFSRYNMLVGYGTINSNTACHYQVNRSMAGSAKMTILVYKR